MRNISELRAVWETPCLIQDERKRLQESKGSKNLNQEEKWQNLNGGKSNSGGGFGENGKNNGNKAEKRRLLLLAQTAEKVKNRQEEEKLQKLKSNSHGNGSDHTPNTPNTTHRIHDGIADNLKEIMISESLVVSCCEKYDRYLVEIDEVAFRCSQNWKTARLNTERQHSFDELTEMLGPFLRARHGLIDWRGSPVLGMQSVTLSVIHSIVRWRKALLDGGKASKPFIWNNNNILLSVRT